jgi:hypothetical protein
VVHPISSRTSSSASRWRTSPSRRSPISATSR